MVNKIEKARELGKLAFAAGKQCIPAFDPEVMTLCRGPVCDKHAAILSAWIDGWTEANLRGPRFSTKK